MGFMDFIKKALVESDNNILNSSLLKSDTDKLFDELYRFIKKYSNEDEYYKNFEIIKTNNSINMKITYMINSIDIITIAHEDKRQKEIVLHSIGRRNSDEYVLVEEIYKYNVDLNDKKLISNQETFNTLKIESILIKNLDFIKSFMKKKIKCNHIFNAMYQYILEKGETKEFDKSLKLITDKSTIFFNIFNNYEDTVFIDLIDKCYQIKKLKTYYICTFYEYQVNSGTENRKILKEIKSADIDKILSLLQEIAKTLEKDYDCVKKLDGYCKVMNFNGYHEAKKIHIPNNVKYINSFAFDMCYELEDIIIPNSVIKIGECAFCKCYKLKNVTLPDSPIVIESSTFFDCKSLKQIKIPPSIIHIKSGAFEYCDNLDTIEILGNNTTFDPEDALLRIKIKCPKGSKADFILEEHLRKF